MIRALLDLHWAITSPSLLTDAPQLSPMFQRAIDTFDPFSIDLAELEAFLSEVPRQRVGHYFERLILYWLSRVCKCWIVAHQYPIRNEQRTIGEIDFLFRDSTGQLHHWETAVKFYLYTPQPKTGNDRLLGPNPDDSFNRKLDHIYQHQLPLSKRIFDEPVCRHAFVKGRIFYPLQSLPERHLDPWPSRLSSAHLRGIWLCPRQFDWFDSQKPSRRYRLLSKPHWLAPERVLISSEQYMTGTAMRTLLEKHFKRNSQAKLCSVMVPHGQYYEEHERLFIVSNDWPNFASRL